MSEELQRPSPPEQALLDKEQRLLRELAAMESVLVAFSGGVDSTYLAWAAHRALGEKALAVTSVCPLVPVAEVREARQLAARIGIAHEEIDTMDMSADFFRTNPPDRCYHCKRALFEALRQLADWRGIRHLAAGENTDDTKGHRPGSRAAEELGVRHPLQDAGLSKADIRRLSARAGLSTAGLPSRACLATRVPYGTPVTPDLLGRIERAEEFLHSLGFSQLRLRHHDRVCRIEVGPDDWSVFFQPAVREKVVEFMKNIGYQYVTLDLEGYRTGAMNEMLGNTAERRRG
jgi:uncharacterized protein